MLKKCLLTVLELIWNQRLGHKKTKLNKTKQEISRRRKNENVYKMSKNEKCTCKACKNTVFHCQICKFVGFLLPWSSWLLKLPTIHQRTLKMLVISTIGFSSIKSSTNGRILKKELSVTRDKEETHLPSTASNSLTLIPISLRDASILRRRRGLLLRLIR